MKFSLLDLAYLNEEMTKQYVGMSCFAMCKKYNQWPADFLASSILIESEGKMPWDNSSCYGFFFKIGKLGNQGGSKQWKGL